MCVDYEDLKCPCGRLFDVEDKSHLVTYWGEDPPDELECPECEHVLTVREHVTRKYEVSE